jgi:hypothetical protein
MHTVGSDSNAISIEVLSSFPRVPVLHTDLGLACWLDVASGDGRTIHVVVELSVEGQGSMLHS